MLRKICFWQLHGSYRMSAGAQCPDLRITRGDACLIGSANMHAVVLLCDTQDRSAPGQCNLADPSHNGGMHGYGAAYSLAQMSAGNLAFTLLSVYAKKTQTGQIVADTAIAGKA